MKRRVQSLSLTGPAGELEALWEEPEPAGSDLAALVCHPHPLYGGTLHNKVVHHTALALQERGLRVLRFNFRGTGQSQGVHDYGRGEADDVCAALSYLEERLPSAGLVLAGFSFGAWVGLQVGCKDQRVQALVGVGLPADESDLSYGSRPAMEAMLARVAPPRQLIWIEGADHFFAGHLKELRAAIRDHLPGT